MRSFALVILLLATAAVVQAVSLPCDSPAAADFDFWIGTWEVHAGGKIAGRNTIEKIHGGCTLLEQYEAAGGPYEGSSFNWYEAVENRWHQVWVDNGGTRLDLEGGLVDGSMVLSGERLAREQTAVDRITWTPNDDGTVRQHWEVSWDSGTTWETLFDGLYKPVTEE